MYIYIIYINKERKITPSYFVARLKGLDQLVRRTLLRRLSQAFNRLLAGLLKAIEKSYGGEILSDLTIT